MKKLDINYIRDRIKQEGYELISNEYKNARTKLKVRCNKGHIYEVKWSDFQQGNRCPKCAGNTKLSYTYVKEQIERESGYNLLSKRYINCTTKLKIRCSKLHIYKTSWDNFKKGNRCPYCVDHRGKMKNRLSYRYVKKQIESERGHRLLSKDYINAHIKLKVQCSSGHNYDVCWNKFQHGTRCPICYNERSYSHEEKEVAEFVKSFEVNIVENDRTQIVNPLTGNNLELDIWVPSLNKAIEYNGIYWHKNRQNIDRIKQKQCKKSGIDLLIINDREWRKNKSGIKNKIRKFLDY